MSLTIDNNRLAQQQALPTQLTTAQTSTAAPAAPAATTATANPAAALISGNAGLTSDLLSVLLQEQSGAGTGSTSGPGFTLAGMLDAQDQAQTDQGQTDSFAGLDPSTSATQQSEDQSLLDSLAGIDPSAAAQSATSTDSVMSGLQDLLDQLAV